MASTHFKGSPIELSGELPKIGSRAPGFLLTSTDLSDFELEKFDGKRIILNIFPSIDTGICAMSVRHFNKVAADLDNAVVICVSRDLPFAQKRFCGAEGIENVAIGSEMRPESSFGEDYGLIQMGGPLAGTLARVVMVLDEHQTVIYSEIVPEITQEPNYEAALEALK
jgi:thioredoxin-dependent peroxiredoxin